MTIRFGDAEHGRAILEAGWGGQAAAFNPGAHRVVSNVIGGKLAGGVVYRNYYIASIEMHVAVFSPYAANRDMLWVCFDYPFMQLGCQKIFVRIPSCNVKSLRFARKLGFSDVVSIEGVYPGCDQIVLVLDRDSKAAQRWLSLDCSAHRRMKEREFERATDPGSSGLWTLGSCLPGRG